MNPFSNFRSAMEPERDLEEDFPGDQPMPRIGDIVKPLVGSLEFTVHVSRYTESPIETMFAVAILRQWHDIELRLPGEPWAPAWTLVPQYPWGRYRVDLAIRRPQGEIIFVECDGHEFHSSPEQIDRERRREQEMRDAGFTVVRFTGSEINYSPAACVSALSKFRWGWGRR